MSTITIRVLELTGRDPTGLFANVAGKYVTDIGNIDDPATWRFTGDISLAKKFDFMSAWNLYMTQSRSLPFRPTDGKPNRPLTAFTVAFENM